MVARTMMRRWIRSSVLVVLCMPHSETFSWMHVSKPKDPFPGVGLGLRNQEPEAAPSSTGCDDVGPVVGKSGVSRREALSLGIVTSVMGASSEPALADNSELYRQAKRPTAYLIDSTIPPTLVPLNAQQETSMLRSLGKGSGSSKEIDVDDSINLNNILNKAVFGTIDALSSLTGGNEKEESKSGPGYSSFVCFGVPQDTQAADVDLALSLFSTVLQTRGSGRVETAFGISFAPTSTQPALDGYVQSGNIDAVRDALSKAGVSSSTLELYMPILAFAKSKSIPLLALAPEEEDVRLVRKQGLQSIDPSRRSKYVIDSQGFISSTQDPKFRVYADRSLLKDFEPADSKDEQGNFFAERILVHETAATVVAQYAASRPDSLVALIAPTPDLRFLGGINGRLPRVYQFLNPETNKVTDDAVTTILLNPTAKETLSLSRFLRLEIGTSPETIKHQTKVADYFWFSTMPKVNMLPRLMNPRSRV